MREVKYPLTEEAQNLAKILVESWNEDHISQTLFYRSYPSPQTKPLIGKLWKVAGIEDVFAESVYKELSHYHLINIDIDGVILLQELRNAVENDFSVSDYYLTMNAVGTIIYGDATISAPFQSNATINSQVSQIQEITQSDITEKLLEGLGESFLKANQPIAEAIKSLKDEPEKSFKQKLGSVISELGNSMQHGANAYVVMQAIATIAPYIQNI